MDQGANGLAGRTDRQMQTFRLPRDLVTFLKAEAGRGNRDLTSHVMRWLEGFRSYFGLPEAATALLEADRKELGMERYEYLLHALYQRSIQLRDCGPGFDAPGGTARVASPIDLQARQMRIGEK